MLKLIMITRSEYYLYAYVSLPLFFFRIVLTHIHINYREGGDADTNGAVCGSMIGAKIGFSELPKDWLGQLANRVRAEAHIHVYTSYIPMHIQIFIHAHTH